MMMVDDQVGAGVSLSTRRARISITLATLAWRFYNPAIAAEINRLFARRLEWQPFEPDQDSPLLVSPFNSRKKMKTLLQTAKDSIEYRRRQSGRSGDHPPAGNKARSGVLVRAW